MTWGYIVWRAAPLFLVIMLVSYFAGDGWRAIPSALVAWGTILLAFATFTLIRHSKEQEERSREAELLKEKHDRDARLINEVINWAIGIDKCNFPLSGKDIEPKDREKTRLIISGHISVLIFNTNEMIGKGRHINIIASIWGKELQDAVVKLNHELYNYVVLLNEVYQVVYKKFDEYTTKMEEVKKHFWDTLDKSANEVIEKATKFQITS